ncbi:TolC family protein [Novosphingobium flavum]|uniref:TolC family protein n=1 Tax=Novosphingobium aerophilum TaxID=2839843 RepID=A0A7X1F9Z0_9SPHN|nr:TolC family protein [Novosphingobium aerophilum]MBC2652884.1 TolC family protein [Novosphingobium aerophilum]MBC2660659.1 TolC family protein [Novosphingobium aerophilum]
MIPRLSLRHTLLLAGILAAGPLTAAAAGARPQPAPPPVEAPVAPAWSAANAAARPAEPAWWRAYGDPALDRLVERALAAGPDLPGALARIDQAQAAARAVGAGRFPSGTVNGSLARTEQSLENGLGQLTRFVPTINRTQDTASLNATLGWDLDLGGGVKNGARAARADLVAAQAGLAATRLALAAEVTARYLDLREAEARSRLVARQRDDLAARLRYAELRLAATEGSARERDARVRELGEAEASLPLLDAQVRAARHALAVLTGRPAGTDLPELSAVGPGAAVPLAEDPAAGTPADLLRARPDLVMAEARIVSARARVKSALGEYWPHVSIGGLLGFDTNRLAGFGTPASRITQGFIGLRWRLFDFARIDAEVAAARGAEREALAAYRDAVLRAGAQVESAFALAAARREALAAQDRRRAAADSAWTSAQAAFRLGEISDDQLRGESLQHASAEADQLAARRALAEAVLDCRKALGG